MKQQMNKYVGVIENWDLGHGNRKTQIQDLKGPEIELEVSERTNLDISLCSTIC